MAVSYCHICLSVCTVMLEQTDLWFYSSSWLNCMKHLYLYAHLHRSNVKHDRFYESYFLSSTKTSISPSAKTCSTHMTDLKNTRRKERSKLTVFTVQANLSFHLLISKLNPICNLSLLNVLYWKQEKVRNYCYLTSSLSASSSTSYKWTGSFSDFVPLLGKKKLLKY